MWHLSDSKYQCKKGKKSFKQLCMSAFDLMRATVKQFRSDKWLLHTKRMQHLMTLKAHLHLVWSISGGITMSPFTHVFSFASCESKLNQAIPISICDAISAWLKVLIIIYYSNPNDFLLSGLTEINKLIFLRF